MKTLLRRLALLAFIFQLSTFSFLATGCSTPPSARVVQVQSLKALGQTAEAAIVATAKLRASGQISDAQADKIYAFYDDRFQPAYRLAVSAARSDLNTLANPELLALAGELLRLVETYRKPSS